MTVKSEFHANYAIFLVFFFSKGMKSLVNQVEISFARSLVVCDMPLQANYTGSAWCGDRLLVINEGFGISQRGQAQESLAMLLSIILVSILGAVYGRRFVVLMGLGGTTASVVLFVIATSTPAWARALFACGQGLQGLLPIDLLVTLILLDLASRPGADAPSVYGLYYGVLTPVGDILWGPIIGNAVAALELVNYFTIWLIILGINISVFAGAALAMNETLQAKKDDDKQDDSRSHARRVLDEVLTYRELIWQPLSRKFLFMVCIEPIWNAATWGIVPVQLMSYHAWSQREVTILFGLLTPLFIICAPILPALANQYGFKLAWLGSVCYIYVFVFFQNTVIAVSGNAAAAAVLLFPVAYSGFIGIKEFVDSRYAAPEHMTRFKSSQWVIGYIMGMFIGPIYARLFDAKAETTFDQLKPNMVALFFAASQLVHVKLNMWSCENGAKATLELADDREDKAKELWAILTANGERKLDAEAWKGADLDKLFFRGYEDKGTDGPFENCLKFREYARAFTGATNDETRGLLARLDTSIAVAQKWAGSADKEGKKKA